MLDEVAHVVVFGELSPKAKVSYTQFLLDNDVKFVKRDSDGRYVANIRLETPQNILSAQVNQHDEQIEMEKPATTSDSQPPLDARLAKVPEHLHQFANLILLLGDRNVHTASGTGVYVKETRLARLINDIYDARYEDSSNGSNAPSESGNTNASTNQFAKFIIHYLTNRFGLKKLVEQQAWDLIEGLASLQHRIDIELFSSFLQGKFSDSTLVFFLFARSTLHRMLSTATYRPSVSTKSSQESDRKPRRSSSAVSISPLWLSKTQVESLSQTIFGSKMDDLYVEFMHTANAFLSSQPASRTTTRLLEANEFLYLAVETHHKAMEHHCDVYRQNVMFDPEDDHFSIQSSLQSPQVVLRTETQPIQMTAASKVPSISNHEKHKADYVVPPESASRPHQEQIYETAVSDDNMQQRLDSLLGRLKKRQPLSP